jgi:hypothetical protein
VKQAFIIGKRSSGVRISDRIVRLEMYPTPTLPLPLKGREFLESSSPFKGEVRRGMGYRAETLAANVTK